MALTASEWQLPGWLNQLSVHEPLVLDIGGEGRHTQAWNLNQRSQRSGAGRAVGPIPRLILARADAMPLTTGSVDLAIIERTPLRVPALRELARVVKSEGVILLRHAITPAGDPHRIALRILAGVTERREFAHRDYWVQETIIRRFHPA